MHVFYSPSFLRMYKKLPDELKDEVDDRVEQFENQRDLEKLKIHKLGGRMKGAYSFSVNYKIRVVFTFLKNKKIVLISVGDHDVYKR